MSNGRIIRLAVLPTASIATSNTDAAFPAANLFDPQPKTVWRSGALSVPSGTLITADLGQSIPVDAVGMLFGNWSPAALWSIRAATFAQGAAWLDDPGSEVLSSRTMRMPSAASPSRFHALALLTGLPSVRHLRIIINENVNPDGVLRAGILAIGSASTLPAWNYDWGGGRSVDDRSDVTPMPGGEFAIWKRARVPLARVTWANLTSAEMAQLFALQLEIGKSDPLILLEQSDPALWRQEDLHYGLLDSIDFYERQRVDKCSWEMRIRNWL